MKKYLGYWPIIAVLLLVIGLWPQLGQAQSFDLSKGIVGNLPAACQNNGDCSFCDFVGLFVILQKIILSLFGGLAIIMLIWGGQGLIMAAGNQEKITASRKLITSTLIGVFIILAAYFLVSILLMILITPTRQSTPPYNPLSDDWWRSKLGCKIPTDSDFCLKQPDGTTCYDKAKKIGTCQNQKCVTP